MHQPDESTSPEGSDRVRRHGLFSRGGDAPAPPPAYGDPRTIAMVAAYQRIVEDRLEEGLRAIQQTAYTLMHEIAGEVWRSAGGNKNEIQAKILESLSRDQAIRSLIAHTDERFQALAVHAARLEDEITSLAEQTRDAKEVLASGVDALAQTAESVATHGMDEVRAELEEVSRQVANAFSAIAERDRAIVETVQSRVREHGELITQETGRIAQAMQAYVQEGVSALGQLAGSVQAQIEDIATRDVEISARMNETAEEQMRLLGEQLQLMYDRLSIDTTSLTEAIAAQGDRAEGQIRSISENLQFLHERISVESRQTTEAVQSLEARTIQRLATSHSLLDESLQAQQQQQHEASQEVVGAVEARVMALAHLVRSDSEAVRRALVQSAAGRDEAMASALDERLGRVSQALTDATRWTVEEMTRRLREETSRVVQTRMDEAVSAIDRNMIRMSDTLETELDRLGHTVGRQAVEAAEAAEAAIAGRLDAATDAIDRAGVDAGRVQQAMEEELAKALDARIGALARMIRSDNQALAERVQSLSEQDAARQSLRAVKEMQANLPAEVVDIVDRRVQTIAEQLHRDVQSTAESVARVSDMLERKVEEMTTRIGKRYDNDIQDVIDRMGDAMHAIATLGRQRPPDRIDLE